MARKDTTTPDIQEQSPAAAAPLENTAKAGGPPSGFYIYIGPTIHGLVRSGTIYRGDRAHALAETRKVIEKYPLVKTLIVSGDYLPVARLKIKTSGNALHANYVKLTEQVRADAAKQAAKKQEASCV